jgi:hypothetical protein
MTDSEAVPLLLDAIAKATRGADPALAIACQTIRKGRPSNFLTADPRPLAWELVLQRIVAIVEAFHGLRPDDLPCPECGAGMGCRSCAAREGAKGRIYTPEEREGSRQRLAAGRAVRVWTPEQREKARLQAARARAAKAAKRAGRGKG